MHNLTRRKFLSSVLVSAGGTLAATLAAPLFAQSAAPTLAARPFNMLVIGDSIMWGQGLREEQKFYHQVYRWLQTEVFKGVRPVAEPRVFAHSDARIFPAFSLDRDFVKENVSNESRLPNPSILFQASTALSEYKKSAVNGPQKVDLILVNGGINDFRVERFLQAKLVSAAIEAYARQFCGHGMGLLLRFLATAFPNARIVVTGYYLIISKKTDPDVLRNGVLKFALGKKPRHLFNIPFVGENRGLRNELARRSQDWVDYSTRYLGETVTTVNTEFPVEGSGRGHRIVFVPAPFGPGNAYGASGEGERPFLWELNDRLLPEDPMLPSRSLTCAQDRIKGLNYQTCKRAAAFHPNPEGAEAYATAIKAELQKIIPSTNWISELS